jgi:aryl-alcohol dehydrogenase-like predicted oxidoreductase
MTVRDPSLIGAGRVFLGSALWGWGTPREEVFAILDTFAAAGGGILDTASNYPINNVSSDFGLASSLISEWLRAHRPDNVSVLYKIGAIDNHGSSATALKASDMLISAELARGKFSDWLGGIAIHWDNRDSPGAIECSLDILSQFAADGLEVGFSGVKRPDLYLQYAPYLAAKWLIQVKENLATQFARKSYEVYFPSARFLAYGINMGGVKGRHITATSSLALRGLEVPSIVERMLKLIDDPPKDLAAPPRDLTQLALMVSWANPSLSGVIFGSRTAIQLTESLNYWAILSARSDAADVLRITSKLRDPA